MHVPRLLIILLLLLFSEQKASSVPIFPKILWAYWNDPIESAPLLVRLCADLMRHYTDLNHWELRIVSQKTLPLYANMTRLNNIKANSKVDFYIQKLSDLLRLNILAEHGGVWFDISTILLEDLTWLQQISTANNIVNKHGQYPQVLLFSYHPMGGDRRIRLTGTDKNSKIRLVPGLQVWFMAAMPKTKFLTQVLEVFERSLMIGYQETVAENYREGILIALEYGEYLMFNRAMQIVLQRKQKQLDARGNNEYAVHQYIVWTMMSEENPFKIQDKTFFFIGLNTRPMTHLTVAQIEEYFGMPRYFIKIIGDIRTPIEQVIQQKSKDYLPMLGVELVCDGSVQIPDGHIVKDSIIDRYLLSSAKPEEFDRSKLYDREFIKQHCGFNYVSVFFKYIFCIAIVIFLLWKLIEKLLQNYLANNPGKLILDNDQAQHNISHNHPQYSHR